MHKVNRYFDIFSKRKGVRIANAFVGKILAEIISE